ncbi:MAG: nucleotidyltransferase family protein [Lachnospiraceae bacterium]|jgi:predicted nucleotidyltransferase|nr:nucleotidyltransferase family protein [Lachnospiraceae bacterium]
MTITAIIAEYNPFHNGHAYQLQKARELTGADALIVIMSGNFVQRGEPAIVNKYTRAQSALENGADLVIELPVCYACGSAEFFARGAVSVLNKLGCVDYLCFGSESGELTLLDKIADILIKEPAAYKDSLKAALKQGKSYPSARKAALKDYIGSQQADRLISSADDTSPSVFAAMFSVPCDADETTGTDLSIMDTPNNILALEYVKELKRSGSTIRPVTLKRLGSAYHNIHLEETDPLSFSTLSLMSEKESLLFSSATAIREALKNAEVSEELTQLRNHMPENAFSLLSDAFGHGMPVLSDDFSGMLHYALLSAYHENPVVSHPFSDYLDVSEDFSDKLQNSLYQYPSVSGLCERLKSKDLTYTRISRNLFHILLHLKQKDLAEYLENGITFYARLLGLNRSNQALTGKLKRSAAIPLISSPAKAESLLGQIGRKQFFSDLFAADLYESVVSQKYHTVMKNEYERRLLCVSHDF